MNVGRRNVYRFSDICLFVFVVLSFVRPIRCADGDGYRKNEDPALIAEIANISQILKPEIDKHLGFGISD